MGFNPLAWFNVIFAALGLIEGLINEPVGGPSVAAPAVLVTYGGSVYAITVSAQKVK